ncbi:FkbM family methyltransferase [Bosea sp. (in: a-proteobacteria)]|uniref:FkbM family methyltransferase n=1 Tax=Bosea sp. (in: a-proteobacteria) TaxID=1871050 RepID=UPI001AD1BBDE|nr:FkbM family methyltransferase [Bosea sp. (in: a-proteobacteria)]MBN9438215.1 FkbM family methyltransferase [Bosea sp. (in: a-proteobacteria)]
MQTDARRIAALSLDRTTGRALAPTLPDRCALMLLDAYGWLSRSFQQRGLYRACRLAGKLLWGKRNASIVLGPDAFVSFPASDPYWNRMLLRSYDHEPELAHFLRALAQTDYGFIDCGANIGYWSVFVASSAGGSKPVLAVEASAPTFALLSSNLAQHSDKVRAFHRAILDRSGVEVRLNDAAHEARGIAAESEAPSGEAVLSIAIDDLIAQAGWQKRRLVVKLDVEGVEREAMAGMEVALGADALVIYEDHGADPTHALTRHLIEDRGFDVHLLLDTCTAPIARAEELDAWKRDRTRGYNLVARRNAESWREVLG